MRAFEDRPDGRVRFAHTAPWWVEIEGRPLRPRREEQEYLIRRVQDEIARSRGIVPPTALAEYEAALAHYERLEPRPDDLAEARPPRNADELRDWLQNMVWQHRFSLDEVQAATGHDPTEVGAALERHNIRDCKSAGAAGGSPLLVLPYPGGRHPRIGFPDGAFGSATAKRR